jgi:hypothetical protein
MLNTTENTMEKSNSAENIRTRRKESGMEKKPNPAKEKSYAFALRVIKL